MFTGSLIALTIVAILGLFWYQGSRRMKFDPFEKV
jgi:hypothetical protein